MFGSWGKHFGIFLLRVLTGAYMAFGHGFGKITAGPDEWTKLGGAMSVLGITFLPVVWGFLAAFSEFVCSLLVALGLFTRTASFLLLGTMGVAALTHILGGDGWVGHGSAELALGYAIVFLALIFLGGGKYSIDASISPGNS